MEKKIIIRIRSDGSIQATSQGIKGKACLKYLPVIETFGKASIVDSNYTEEYFQQEEITMHLERVQRIGEGI